MSPTPTRGSRAGVVYNDLRNLARRQGRDPGELFTLYALEGFLARLTASDQSSDFVLKGGMLMAAFAARRPTRDIDLAALGVANDIHEIRDRVRRIVSLDLDDGLSFDPSSVAGETIRDDADYAGVRVKVTALLATARIGLALTHAQTVIVGAAEKSLPAFFEDFRAGQPQARYDDQAYSVEELAIPARDRQNQSKSLRVPTIIADRGCNMRCSFCAISEMWRSRPRPVGHVIDEIKSMRTNKLIFFDPNFFRPREYAIELMTELAKLGVQWGCNSTADTAFDDELLELAERSGCYGVLIGFESITAESLKSVHKRYRQVDNFREIVDRFHAHHIAVNGCWVLGFDHDTEESILAMPERIREIGCDLTRIAIMTPLPGSRMFDRLEEQGRIIDYNWDNYDQRHAVFQPTNMTPKRLEELHDQVWRDAYRMREVLGRVRRSSNRTLREKAYVLGANLGFKYLDL